MANPEIELLYVIYTHNRPTVLRESLRSLFANNDLKPQRVVIIDDGSNPQLKEWLSQQVQASESVIDLLSFKSNVGYGRVAEIGFAVADMFRPHYCFFIESDYVFRKHGLDEVMDVFRSEWGTHLAGVAGYSHPHFFDRGVTSGRYIQEIVAQHGEDVLNRELLYRPFEFQSRFGTIDLQFVSNSCGTMYLNWRLISELRQTFYPRMEIERIVATCSKSRRPPFLNDGVMSQGLSYFWSLYAKNGGWDLSKYAALIDIIPRVANHLCGGGITGSKPGVNEGETFMGSPNFPRDYNNYPHPERC